MNVITLTTDFGYADWFAGAMKGVVLRLHPRATVVDISHDIQSGDIWAGAFALAASYRFFPRGTVHVAVVDPGVGSQRAALAVQTLDYFFVGPDNGILSLALRQERIQVIHRIENEKYFLHPVSRTFHGRDIFAPVAAHLSRSVPCSRLGPTSKDMKELAWPEVQRDRHGLRGQVVYVDRFGNAITNLSNELLHRRRGRWTLWRNGKELCAVEAFYEAVAKGKLVAVPGSSGFLEIAINGGSAAIEWGLRNGSKVMLRSADR
jgi:S-adenosylmethionine hydrolase